jgi:hypothetical protein
LKTLPTPKLFLDLASSPKTQEAFRAAGTPKQIFQIAPGNQAKYLEAIHRFLDGLPAQP